MTDYLTELEQAAEGDDLDVAIAQPPAMIDETLAAKLVARRRHRLRDQAAFNEAWDEFMAPLLELRTRVTERNRLDIERVETLLGQMLAARQADDPGCKRIDVPGATLRSRVQQPEWVYDLDVYMPWADGDLIRFKSEPDKATAKKLFNVPEGRPGDTVRPVTADGEVVPGVTVTYRAPKLIIDTGGDQ